MFQGMSHAEIRFNCEHTESEENYLTKVLWV